jgi:hypothetical protein
VVVAHLIIERPVLLVVAALAGVALVAQQMLLVMLELQTQAVAAVAAPAVFQQWVVVMAVLVSLLFLYQLQATQAQPQAHQQLPHQAQTQF